MASESVERKRVLASESEIALGLVAHPLTR